MRIYKPALGSSD